MLRLNENWHKIDRFSDRYPSIRLSEFDGSINEHVDSLALKAYLKRVKEHLLIARKKMDECFDYFMDYAHPFLKHQIVLSREFEQSQARFNKDGENLNSIYSTPLNRALNFMGFEKKPDKEDLKKRYKSLAKFHPDCPGGSSEKFKELSDAFQQIAKRI